ncbi:MAG: FtsQ-type POTRA domain-containing protein, partial [Chloroflexi bacterium]|nr:FtsQ-type POTRA domain-containing protein [Chloroflexota bacterium]
MKSTKNRKDTRRPTRSARKVPQNKIKPNYMLLFSMFAASIVVSGGISYALHTPSLNVKEITIQGVHLCREDGVSAMAKPALGGNILLLHKSPIVARIRRLSEVRDVTMGRVFPDKVWIRVRERKAYAMFTDGRDFYMAQSDGLVFHKAEGPVKGLPI